MALLLRAITTPADPTDLSGVQALELDGLVAWATEVSEPGQTFTKQDLLADHRLVEAIFERVEACLPARFPTLVDAEALRANVAVRRAELERQLEHVRGCCEIAATAVWTAVEDDAPQDLGSAQTPGRRYLLDRQAHWASSDRRRAHALQLADQIEHAAGAALIEAMRSVCPSPSVALSMALLVKRLNSMQVVEQLPRSQPDVRILLHGPWPPYSFAGAGAGSERGDGRRTGTVEAAASAHPGGTPESDRRRP